MAKILVVTNDSAVREPFARLMRAKRWEIAEVVSGVKALEFLEESDTDLIVADMNTPDVPGLALLEFFKTRAPQIPVVLVTANDSFEATRSAVRLGTFDILTKPIHANVLLAVVERALAGGKYKTRATDGYSGCNPVIMTLLARGGASEGRDMGAIARPLASLKRVCAA